MTDQESYYDEHVAPALATLANACGKRGMTFIAYVKFGPGESDGGRTTLIPTDAADTGATVLLIDAATKAVGNLDAVAYGMARYPRESERPHSSCVLRLLGVEPRVEDR